jgi:hypothetical protein
VRALRDKMDDQYVRLDAKIDGLKASISTTQAWAIALYVALAAGMLGTMARGFGWI